MRQHEFDTTQQKQAMEREHGYEIELLNIELGESRTKCDDLQRMTDADDPDSLAQEFRDDLWDARNDNNALKKKHIEEVRQLERDRDVLLRDINLLRIRTDRMDSNTDEAVASLQLELEQKQQELEHYITVSG